MSINICTSILLITSLFRYFQMQQEKENWQPLQSNAQVINPYIGKMGLKTELFSFQQMLSTEDWALDMIPKPVLGVLFLYEMTQPQVQFKAQQAQTLHPEQVPKDIFYMKQYAYNACGTIGLFHIVLNAIKKYPNIIVPGSYLDKFQGQGQEKNAEDRGKLLKQSKTILEEHKSASSKGQSECKQESESHFISFIVKDGRLYQMDGFKVCPVDHGPCTQDQILKKSSEVIKKFMNRDPNNIHFSMLVLAKTPEQQ